jgi:RNA-directed DNA polymerase
VSRLLLSFLKAGVLSEGTFLRTDVGTPQGGILSPLLANVALSAIDERYTRYVWDRHGIPPAKGPTAVLGRADRNRRADRRDGLPVYFPIRYADDFIVLVSVPPGPDQLERASEAANQEKAALAAALKEELNLELSETKTLVTPVTKPMRFLGHHVRVRAHPDHGRFVSTTVIPKERSQSLRRRIKDQFRRDTTGDRLENRLRRINRVLRGWSNFYRHSWGAKRVFGTLDHYLWWTIYRWLRKKHQGATAKAVISRYGRRARGRRAIWWGDGSVAAFVLSRTPVHPFGLGWMRPPSFVIKPLESPVHNERCTPGSERGTRRRTR